MPKRVHELAKELNMESKELINYASRLGIENKKPVSNFNDDEIKKVKDFLGNKDKPVAKPTQQKPMENKPKSPEQREQRMENRPQGQGNYQPRGDRPQGQGNYQSRGDRPQGQGGYQPRGDRPQGQGNYQPRGDRPQGQGNYQPRGDRPQGQGNYQPRGDRPQGQGNYQPRGDRPQGQGSYQPRGDRPQGQGGYQQRGDRPQGQGGYQQRGDRPQGQGGYQQRGDRPQGQGGYQQRGDRPQGQGGYQQRGDRPPFQKDGNRDNRSGGQSSFNRQGARPSGGGFGANKPASGGLDNSQQKPVNTRYNQNKQIKSNKDKYNLDREKAGGAFKKQAPQTKKITKQDRKKQKLLLAKEREIQALEEAKLKENDIKTIQIGKSISVKDFAEKMGKTTSEVIMPLMKLGIMATINQEIDFYTATNIAETFDILVEELDEVDILEEAFSNEEENEADIAERPPVVVVMGHVDHGKTSLLDTIRSSKVTVGEAGGITQHIGAYTVEINDRPITFLDTPGHEAFTAMRSRGAKITDIAVLVVAADDGVMPQTIEAINHAKAAEVDIIVAINKIDKEAANPDRVKQELTEHGIIVEDYGGETIAVPVSAKANTNIDTLLEMILLTADMRELKANPKKRAKGTVIEAQLDRGRGPVATVLIQEGTLNVGDPIVVGRTHGRIRAMMDDKGAKVKKAGPSIPVEILGLSGVPSAGDMFYIANNERQARQLAESMNAQSREDMIKATPQKVSLDDLFSQIKAGEVKDLNIIIKADVQGSVEAVKNSLERLSNDEVRIRPIHGGVGAITESDVMLASASNAIIIGFNVRPDGQAKAKADEEKVDMRLYRIIYNAIEDIQAAMKGMLDPVFKEKVIGHADVRQTFKASNIGTIAGSYITDGKLTRNSQVRIVRDGIVVYDGTIAALRRFKDDVREVASGYECGITFTNFNDVKEGDKIEAYIMEEIER